jgi:cell division protein FtsN
MKPQHRSFLEHRLAAVPALLLATAILFTARGTLADDLYKTVDAQGHVTYSDHPLSKASERISVEVNPPNAQEAARLTKEQAAESAADAQRAKQDQHDEQEQQKKAAQQAAQKQRCDAARGRYAMFAAGGRIFRTDADGNRVYYSDQEIEDQRAATKAAMDSACN